MPAMGLPVVSARHSGIGELVVDAESGFLLPEKDVAGLVEKIACLIDRPDIYRQMARRGRVSVRQHYNITILNRQLQQVFEKLMVDN